MAEPWTVTVMHKRNVSPTKGMSLQKAQGDEPIGSMKQLHVITS